MDIAAYLKQQKQIISQRSSRVKDFSVFDFNYVPTEPLVRDETRELLDAMLRFEVTGVATHMAIVGSRGSGKTLTMRHLQAVVPQQASLELLYANCRSHNTSYKILGHLLGESAAGASLGQLFERFLTRRKRKAVVVLDEIDLMSPKDKRREILYLLSRCEHPFMVIMLSNSPQVLKQLDAATRSSLQPIPLHFRDYDATQIREILTFRAQQGLHSCDQARLEQIAALATKLTNSDARVAIKTLFYDVTQPEDDLDTCFQRARRDIVVDMIGNLSDGNLMILWAAATSESDLAKPIYARYCRYSQDHGDKPFSYVHFYSNLSYLQSMGLVALASTKVKRTYTNRILLTFDRSIVQSLCQLRFG
jgi:archaeal cell division control protein 6